MLPEKDIMEVFRQLDIDTEEKRKIYSLEHLQRLVMVNNLTERPNPKIRFGLSYHTEEIDKRSN